MRSFNFALGVWRDEPNMQLGRAEASTVVIGHTLIVAGGLSGDWEDARQSTAESLDLRAADSQWHDLPHMPSSVDSAAAAAVGPLLCMAGGHTEDGSNDTLMILNTETMTWRVGSPLPEPRVYAGGGALNGKFYVVGGFDSTRIRRSTTVYVYDPTNDSWTTTTPLPDLKEVGAGGSVRVTTFKDVLGEYLVVAINKRILWLHATAGWQVWMAPPGWQGSTPPLAARDAIGFASLAIV